MAASSARMEVFECPICAPKRYFVTEIGLRTHVADRHPWRSLPPAQQRIPPTRAALPEPAWLREQQGEAASSELDPRLQPGVRQQQPPPQQRDTNNAVTFDTQSLLSDEVFFDDGGGGSGGGGGRQAGQQVGARQQRQNQNQRQQLQQRAYNPSPYAEDLQYPAPDYDLPAMELAQAVDSVDSSTRKKRDLVTGRRPWYDSDDYAGPRNLMEKPGGYYQFDEAALNGPPPQGSRAGYSRQRMIREMDDRDSRIETLRLEIDRLWDERMRLLKAEAERTRAVKDQAYGLQTMGQAADAHMHGFRPGRDHQVHAFQPVLPHSRLQIRRIHDFSDRRGIDY